MPILGILASSRPAFELVGSYDSLATVTSDGSTGIVTFAGIPSTYKHLQLRYIARSSSGADGYITLNGSTSASRRHWVSGDGSAAGASSDALGYVVPTAGSSDAANIMGVGVIDILDYANTNKNKVTRTLGGIDKNGSGYVILYSGLWITTSAISSFSITAASGNWTTATTFALYGIK
jgi:hypothetical protein